MNNLLIDSNFFNVLEKAAYFKKLAHEQKFKLYMEFIINFCKNNVNVILFMNELDQEINIYTNNSFYVGKDICDKLYEQYQDPYFKLSIVNHNMLSTINWKYYLLCKIYDLGIILNQKKTLKIIDLIQTINKDNIRYFNDVELIIYSLEILTDLEKFSYWEHEFITINKLMIDKFGKNFDIVKGGENKSNKHDDKLNIKHKEDNIVDVIKSKLITDFLPKNEDFILSGVWVYNLLNMEHKKNKLYTLEEIDLIMKYKKENDIPVSLQKFIEKYNVTVDIMNRIIRIPFDEFTEKFTIFIMVDRKRIPIINIYNTGSFKLIPYIKYNDIKICGISYLLKTIFINIYWQNIYKNANIIDENKYDIKTKIYYNIINNILDNNYLKKNIFKEDYFGTFVEKTILLKEKNLNKMFYPYYPFLSSKYKSNEKDKAIDSN